MRAHALGLARPVLFGLLGPGQPDLTELAESVLAATAAPVRLADVGNGVGQRVADRCEACIPAARCATKPC